MENGRISKAGSFDECLTITRDQSFVIDSEQDINLASNDEKADKSSSQEMVDFNSNSLAEPSEKNQQEVKASGVVSKETFLHYARAMGGLHSAMLLLALFFVTQGAVLVCIAMMGKWSERPKGQQVSR